jgi:hypothetical protein
MSREAFYIPLSMATKQGTNGRRNKGPFPVIQISMFDGQCQGYLA